MPLELTKCEFINMGAFSKTICLNGKILGQRVGWIQSKGVAMPPLTRQL